LLDSVGSQVPITDQVKLKLSDVLGSELIRRPMEIFRELPQSERMGFYDSLGIITTLEFLQHHFAKLDHREPLCDPTLYWRYHCRGARHAQHPPCQRLISNDVLGFQSRAKPISSPTRNGLS
jgi:hypothetical protein